MATPTASKHPQVVATPPVSTPFSTHHPQNPAFSPHGPRSVVPSPQQVKKSPANSSTLYGYGSGAGGGGAGGFGGGYDSPSAAMALGGVDLEGMGMGHGLGGVLGGRQVEDERRRKLEDVISILSVSKGRLSAAGVERLAQRLGLEIMWQDNMRDGSKTLIIAGPAHLALDIDFMSDVVQKVALSFPDSPDIVTRHTEKAGNILLEDLKIGPEESTLTKSLNRFAANLERLAALDKLSGNPGLNCHEAIAGIYENLEKLHEWEVQKVKADSDMAKKDHEFVQRAVMCTRSGKPVMHSRDRLGLSLDYWQNKRMITRKRLKHEEEKTWSLLVECAPLPSLTVFPPLRVSQEWISQKIVRDTAANDIFAEALQPQLDWQEPDSTVVPAKADAMGGVEGSKEKVLDVIFMAKFDPPLIVPYSMAMTIYNSTNAPFDMYQTSRFDGLMFPHSGDLVDSNASRTINSQTTIQIPEREGREGQTRIHKNTLLIDKIGYGRTLTELPFSHPQQLVAMLPSLRKYAFLSSLLLKTFGPGLEPTPISAGPQSTILSKSDEFSKFMSNEFKPATTFTKSDLSLDAMLQIDSEKVRLRVIFPMRKEKADLQIQIKLNGAVEIESENVLNKDEGTGKSLKKEDLARALEVCEDLGIWAEFIRWRLA
ncbi:hypothetical protein GLAREA_03142 [Glarea lozoyensis ATCC 20868]|uniref:Mediator of RNA polymerase II transcription subunit 1 n=1 Tax=Glarea lozoyensis (strain ATCC 20868 / MF5171) TaxID=1116229 RepID=S3CL37_GLAL2|nr:uncharacterized protein GLAREA_03142 [Glarea lozoyensis ATCC 20868]EPE27227.1 hypothetical protein GLAREA_03142 [Glarea lozoyensis ATCC 20868]